MADDDFLAEMAKDKGDAKETKKTVASVTSRNAGKQPGPPPSQTTNKGPKDGKGK